MESSNKIITANFIPIPAGINRALMATNPDGQGGLVNVTLPGYGKCQVPREAVVLQEDVVVSGAGSGEVGRKSINSLSVCAKLLSQIGWSLRSLNFFMMDEWMTMTAILKSCPKLTSLYICLCFSVDLKRLITTYEHFQAVSGHNTPAITSLELINISEFGVDHGWRLQELLGDPSSYLAESLLHLTIATTKEYKRCE